MLLGVKLLEREWGIRSAIFYIDNHAVILATQLSPHQVITFLTPYTATQTKLWTEITTWQSPSSGFQDTKRSKVMKKQTNKQRKPSQKAVAPSTGYQNTYKTWCYTASQHASKPSTTNSKHRCKKNGKNLHVLTEWRQPTLQPPPIASSNSWHNSPGNWQTS